jgi:glycosyltransferase involved in cell wall biosynthesis
MKVLSIFPFPLLPLTHGGRVRAYRLAVGLARAGANVDLCCPWHPTLPLGPFEREGVTIHPFAFAANLLPALLGDRIVPALLQLSAQPFTSGPRRLLRRSRFYDLVEFHFCAYASWMEFVAPETRVVYSAHNVEWDFALTMGAAPFRRFFGRQIGRLERRAVHASDLTVTCTAADAERLAELYGPLARFAVISNGFDENEIGGIEREVARTQLGLKPEELAILFIGGPAAHNRRAVQFLERELLPRLKQRSRLVIAGQCAPPRRDSHVLSVGRVGRLSPLLAAADVAVNPIDSGSGSNVKLAEYLAAGLPVITTPFGLRGYEKFAHLVTVAELDQFVDAIQAKPSRVIGAPPQVSELGWGALGQQLYDVYADVLRQKPHSRSVRSRASFLR